MTRQPLFQHSSPLVCLLVVLGLAMLVSACATGSSPSTGGGSQVTRSVGTVANQPGLIGIVADKGQKKVLAYYCDDKTVGQWFEGTLGTDGTFDLTNASGSRLQGTVTATGVDGTLDLVQAARSDPLAALVIPLRGQLALQEHFNATSVTGQEGIYRVQTTENGSQYTGGWVVENTRIRAGLVKKATQVIGATPFDPEKSPTVTTADGVVLRPALVDTIIALSA